MFLFHVELVELAMRPGRSFFLDASASFRDLHLGIQDAFGWENCHLWDFRRPDGTPLVESCDEDGNPLLDAARLRLSSYFSGTETFEWCRYIYDYGDDWVHEVKLVSRSVRDTPYARELMDGILACPPEDCGGAPGCENILQFLVTGEDQLMGDPEALADWIGDFHPEDFDVRKVARKFNKKRLPQGR